MHTHVMQVSLTLSYCWVLLECHVENIFGSSHCPDDPSRFVSSGQIILLLVYSLNTIHIKFIGKKKIRSHIWLIFLTRIREYSLFHIFHTEYSLRVFIEMYICISTFWLKSYVLSFDIQVNSIQANYVQKFKSPSLRGINGRMTAAISIFSECAEFIIVSVGCMCLNKW